MTTYTVTITGVPKDEALRIYARSIGLTTEEQLANRESDSVSFGPAYVRNGALLPPRLKDTDAAIAIRSEAVR